jgi:acyl carrier protein
MVEQRVEQRVIQLIASRVVEPEKVTAESTLDELECIWLVKMGILIAVEDEFGIDIDESDIEGLDSVGKIISYVGQKARPN